jgi:hypothetical protein
MNDMLTAFHFIRYLELRRKEEEFYRDYPAQPQFSVGLGIFRRLRKSMRRD